MGEVAQSQEDGLRLVRQLVGTYAANVLHYRSADYDELSTRTGFIDKFFEALGWNVTDSAPDREVLFHNRYTVAPTVAGDDEWDDDLTDEERDARARHTDVLDYLFRVDGQLRFCVEAKRPHAGIGGNAAPFQVKTYAWNQQLPFGILTDFENLKVYVTTLRPDRDQPNAGLLRGMSLTYTDYERVWPELWGLFSREAVARGEAERRARAVSPRGAKPVDEVFLTDLETWRTELANDIRQRHPDLELYELEEATQRIVDRLVFVRVIEDRNIEPRVVLRRFARMTDAYRHLSREFRYLDDQYNGQLFARHYSEDLEVSDGQIQRLIASLYAAGGSPYRFDIFSADFLGKVYERFLGTQLTLAGDGQLRLVVKPEVRHAGGVYYTPRWVVDHMCAAALDPLLEGRRPDQVAELRIVDPACGSGTFLLGVLDHLIAWHERYYDAHPNQEAERHYVDAQGHRRLTSDLKGRIALNNVFGVDVDPRAVEVAQMSVYLRILEQETASTLSTQARLFPGAYLPTLSRNIRSGNSLIEPDMLPSGRLPEHVIRRINPFAWRHDAQGFGGVFADRSGFDVVVGNPPYTRVQVLRAERPEETAIVERHYTSAAGGSFDIASLFIEKGMTLLRPRPPRGRGTGGVLTYITTRGFVETDAATPVRKLLSEGQHVASIIDFRAGRVFPEAGAYTAILKATHRANPTWRLTRVPDSPTADALRAALGDPLRSADVQARLLTGEPWSLLLPEEEQLVRRLTGAHPSLKAVTGDSIFQGVITGNDSVFRVIDLGADEEQPGNRLVRPASAEPGSVPLSMELTLLRPIWAGRSDFRRFLVKPSNEWLIMPYTRERLDEKFRLMAWGEVASDAPGVADWLKRNETPLRSRSGAWTDANWFSYSRRQNLEAFAAPKVMVPSMLDALCAHFDTESHYFVNVSTGGYGVGNDPLSGADPEYVAALLNSNLLSWILGKLSRAWRGGWFEAKKGNLSRLPIAVPRAASQQETVEMYREVRAHVALHHQHPEDPAAARLAQTARSMFDEHIYRLYGLSVRDRDLVVAQ